MQNVQNILPIGSVVRDRYIVEALLGKGGFSAVYRVRDLRVKGNMFALKEVIDPSKQERDRFQFEGEVLKRLDHPALPRVYRVFEDEKNDRAYMLMDYIEGPNLEMLRQQQPGKRLSLSQVMTIMGPIVSAVGYLHQQRPPIIHRDIKPANIIVPPSGQGAVLVDFGIAKEYEQDSTTTAVRHCSPGYGAPEQYARGTNTRTDIYGLAATFYTLLSGLVPADALYRMTQLGNRGTDPLEPVNQLTPTVPAHVADAIQRAMSINSNERFPTVEDLWQALNTQPIIEQVPATPVVAPNGAGQALATPTIAFYKRPLPGPNHSRSRSLLALLFAVLVLLAFMFGLVFGTGLWPSISHQGQPTPSATSHPVHRATAAPTTKPTLTPATKPTPTPTATPTPRPAATPTPKPPSYPVLVSSGYDGTIHNTPATISSTMSLTQIQQQGTNISGYFSVGPDLQGNGSFTGTVAPNSNVQFLVQSFANHLPLFFQGKVHADGSMSGQYCSYRLDRQQCDYNAGGYGTWSVTPTLPSSS